MMMIFVRRFLLLGRWLEALLLRWKIFAGAPLDRMCACGYSDGFLQVPTGRNVRVVTLINFRRCPTGQNVSEWLLR